MTYCLGMLLRDGLILMADTRTNAGVDNFSVFRKLHVLANGPAGQIFACTAGNLSISQSVISLLQEDLLPAGLDEEPRSLAAATSMFQVAGHVGAAVQHAQATAGAALIRARLSASVDLLLGGRTAQGRLRLFLVYSEGNFIECTPEAPFLQIGETKYGRPILDRALGFDTPLEEAVKIGLLSFDSTMESNLGVALPIDLVVLPAAPRVAPYRRRIERDDPYFRALTASWADYLRESVRGIPSPPWLEGLHGG